MGLSVSLSNALSGMRVGNDSLDVLSRNISNAGTPGYHRQSLSVIDRVANSPYARSGSLERVFNTSLQTYYSRTVADTGYANARSSVLNQLQAALGKPGDANSLDTVLNSFRNALSTMATSPDDPTARSDALSKAKGMADALNRTSREVQTLREGTETQLASDVTSVNQMLKSLEQVNNRLKDQVVDDNSRASLLDQRDRLISQISELVGVRADYRDNGTVALTTLSGVGLLDIQAGHFEFTPAGRLTPGATYDVDPTKSGVGQLTLVTSSGLRLDMVAQGALQSGEMAGLIEMRDNTLVSAQAQLDQIAAGLARAFSTTLTDGTPASSSGANGFDLDLSQIQSGNDFIIRYSEGGAEKTVKVVRVDDTTKLPMNYTDADGVRLIGMSFAGGAASVASQLSAQVGGLTITGSGSTLRVLDDGAAGSRNVLALTARTTSAGVRDNGAALSLFVDSNNASFTGSLDGAGQQTGFASRITINSAVLADNRVLVQHVTGAALGDSTRANYLLNQMSTMRFNPPGGVAGGGGLALNGTVGDLVGQTLNLQGETVAAATAQKDQQTLTLESVDQRMSDEYGVDVDSEMARLMELQNAYAANAHVISVIQELLNTLMQI